MGKTWVLDTETKGTGATMVPLESVLAKPARTREPIVVPRPNDREERKPPEPEPRAPLRFRVVDLMTRQTLAEGDGRATVDALKHVRSVVDVNLYVWDPEQEDWQLLTLDERRAVWALRNR